MTSTPTPTLICIAFLLGSVVSNAEASLLRVDTEVEVLECTAIHDGNGENERVAYDTDTLGSESNDLGEVNGTHTLAAAILSTSSIVFTKPRMIFHAYRILRLEGSPWPLIKVPRRF